ncbi:16S rRNA (guanine(966)-N(2))-methyltransferase [Mycoplasmopsis meleagridis]|uniref:16S rRNA (Guanine (966)-N(2))-methyltransferase, SSU rRNA m(2) G966 n=1 Tax=Mycoplasmopsis meleagridis ATCC 25294 TaxID=1264554 RepID=A0A0F5H1E9_9BACT|nr:16S rRNA (guanine(966)-N(2))-methyltransferase RsmD [Mycoplasmopsis meleagridis]KKB26980.1 16S rRNA (guanine (966)-N(2))-methyltransferase, SSU rRNA m(2) G966 [Mycoplasmopsis meleagridis ATCC 25294]KUH47202.1 16S rRNA (guanine(966)-N(2))-methyltransferase RsmD [Mycoplasmopsis meleagridis]OAD18569.1 16S rRNA (guanine(966)-N(2))-methyltransferase [Mycoplasmopsis meleagridis]VEU77562.1 N6-adenine-specific methylase [Mycoplasmopsis meleagridis]
MLRIISGIYRSRKIEQPNTFSTRPTMDRVREAIFNSIRYDIKDKLVVDLFAGSGSMGFEALSNGAMKVYFVDNNTEAIKTINRNKEILNVNNLTIYKSDALDFLKHSIGKKFDYFFMDAPFKEYELINKCINYIYDNKLLSINGIIVVETDSLHNIILKDGLVLQKWKKYGKIYILFIALNN